MRWSGCFLGLPAAVQRALGELVLQAGIQAEHSGESDQGWRLQEMRLVWSFSLPERSVGLWQPRVWEGPVWRQSRSVVWERQLVRDLGWPRWEHWYLRRRTGCLPDRREIGFVAAAGSVGSGLKPRQPWCWPVRAWRRWRALLQRQRWYWQRRWRWLRAQERGQYSATLGTNLWWRLAFWLWLVYRWRLWRFHEPFGKQRSAGGRGDGDLLKACLRYLGQRFFWPGRTRRRATA